MKISIRKEAEQEMMDAREWYEVRLPGLGDVFGLSVEQALSACFAQEVSLFIGVYSAG